MNMSFKLLAAVVLTVGVSSLAAPANAAPIVGVVRDARCLP